MSNSMVHALLIVAVEVITVMILLGAFVFFQRRKQGRKDTRAAEVLIEKVNDGEGDRRGSLVKVFSEVYGLEGDELQAMVDQFVTREKAFYKVLLSTYLNRDADKLPSFVGELEKMVLPYVELVPPNMVDASEIDALNADLDEMREKNEDLSKELQINKGIIEEMMSEYTAAFDKGKETDRPIPVPGSENTQADTDSTPEESADSADSSESSVEVAAQSPDEALAEEWAAQVGGEEESSTDDAEESGVEFAAQEGGESEVEVAAESAAEAESGQGAESDTAATAQGGDANILGDDELDALFDVPDAQEEAEADSEASEAEAGAAPVAEQPESESSGNDDPTMSDDELDALFDVSGEEEAGPDSEAAPESVGNDADDDLDESEQVAEIGSQTMSEEELNALFDAPSDEPLPNESDVIDIDLGDADEPPAKQ